MSGSIWQGRRRGGGRPICACFNPRHAKPPQSMLAAAFTSASLGVHAQAPRPPDAEAGYPANRLRCVVVAGSSVRYAEPKAQELAAIMNRSITKFVNEEF